jgi:hypothetical protein
LAFGRAVFSSSVARFSLWSEKRATENGKYLAAAGKAASEMIPH